MVENLTLTISNMNSPSLNLLQEVSLSVKAGRIHALLGPSGSGKSTLLYTLNRLREITEGQIKIDGEDIRSLNILELRRRVGFVMQKAIFFSGTVGDNILYGPRLKTKLNPSRSSVPLPDPRFLLQLVGLDPEWVSRDPNTLSGGQQQRVSLARTLANEPEVLLLDEPTAALDTQGSIHLENLITRLCAEHHLTVIWVTHDLRQAQRVAEDVTLLYRGQVIEQNTAAAFFEHPETEKGQAYLAGKLEGSS